MPFTENELKHYLTEHFMNAPSTTHLEIEEEEDAFLTDITSTKKTTAPLDDKVVFKYLEKDSLSLDIEYKRDYLKQYTLHLCLYEVVQTLRLPYIRYLFSKINNNYEFPSTSLNMRPFIEINESKYGIISSSEDTDETSDISLIDEEFLNQINSFFEKQTSTTLNMETMYKGFLEDKNNNIFVFVDMSSESFVKPEPMEWAIIDEIINAGNIRNVTISNVSVNLFKQYEFLHYLSTKESIKVQFPKIGYICDESENGEYINLFKTDESNNDKLLVPPSIDHELYDNIYIFSAIPLSVSNLHHIRRFACFVENEEEEENEEDEIEPIQDNITFSDNDIQYYGLYELDLFNEL